MCIFIIGFMGSGKSTLGASLARLAGVPFTDLDEIIESSEGLTVSEIFRRKGEEYFRLAESELLRKVVYETGKGVIATGGGTPCFGSNINFMNKAGITVYLRLSAEDLYNRLRGDSDKRPLLEGLNDQELAEFIVKRLAEREPFYSQAKIICDKNDQDPRKLMKLISSGG